MDDDGQVTGFAQFSYPCSDATCHRPSNNPFVVDPNEGVTVVGRKGRKIRSSCALRRRWTRGLKRRRRRLHPPRFFHQGSPVSFLSLIPYFQFSHSNRCNGTKVSNRWIFGTRILMKVFAFATGAESLGFESSSKRLPSWGAGSSKRRRFWRARVSPVSWVVPSWTTRPSVSRTTSSRWRGNEWDCSVRPRPISTTSSNSRPTPSFVYYLPATPHKQKCLNSPRLVKFHSSERVVAMKNYFVILPQNFAKNTWSFHRKSSQFFERWILFS